MHRIVGTLAMVVLAFALIIVSLPGQIPGAHAFSCSNYEHPETANLVEGCIVDANTQNPVSGINVYLLSCGGVAFTVWKTTDSNGYYSFQGSTSPPACIASGDPKPILTVNGVTPITSYEGCTPQCNGLGTAADNPTYGQWAGDIYIDGSNYGQQTVSLQAAAIKYVPVAGLYSDTGFASLTFSSSTSISNSVSIQGGVAGVSAGFSSSETNTFTTTFGPFTNVADMIVYPYYVIPYYCAGSSSYASFSYAWSCSQGVKNIGVSGPVTPQPAGTGKYVYIPQSETLTPSTLPTPSLGLSCTIPGPVTIQSQTDLSNSFTFGYNPTVSFYGVSATLGFTVSTSSGTSSATAVQFSSMDTQPLNVEFYPASGNCPNPNTGGVSFGPVLHVWDTSPTPPDISMSVSQSSVSLIQGGGQQVSLYLTSSGDLSAPVSLTASAPTGVTVSFAGPNPATVSSATTTIPVNINVNTNAPCGQTFPISITATNSQFQLNHYLSISVSVSAPQGDFCFSPAMSTASITGPPGSSSPAMTLYINSAANDNIAFSATPQSGTGITASFNPTTVPVTAGSTATTAVTFTLPAGSTLTAGTYTATITGIGSTKSHSITMSVFYSGDYSLSPFEYSVNMGIGTAPDPIYVQSNYGFSGNVYLSASTSGVSASLYSPSTTVPQGSSVNDPLTITAYTTGTYYITINANYYGGQYPLSHTITITVNVSSGSGGGGGGGGPPRPM